jgi:hypothetical protein
MMEAAHTFETSVDNYFTRQYIPEDKSELHTRRRENLEISQSIECFPGIVSRYFCKLLLTIPVAPMITGMTKHFIFHIL